MSATRRTWTWALAASLAAALAPSAPAAAAGMITHTWMAEEAVELLDTPELRELILAHLDQMRSGAKFPDGGYFPGSIHGEEAHWQRFADVRVEMLRARSDCGDLADPDGPCAAEIAHLMGTVAHGTGDEVWDWLFEPHSPDRDEYYLHPDLSAFQDEGGQELVMDLVAIARYGVQEHFVPPLPSKPDLIAAFEAAGLPGVMDSQLEFGQTLFSVLYGVESAWAADHADAVMANMPWMSENLVTAPGGVEYAARSIAGQWEALWAQILGEPQRTRISNTYPADTETGIPASGWIRTYLPGSHRGRGGARTRISASLTYSLPYREPGGPGVSNQLPAGAMILSERDTGAVLPTLASFPRAVPYTADPGEHTIGIQPGVELEPCTWYQVDVTEALLDARHEPVEPYSWSFRTGADAEGTACPDDPPDAAVLAEYVARVYRDLLGREADAGEVDSWVLELRRGLAPEAFVGDIVDSDEYREQIVDGVFRADLERDPRPEETSFWATRLRTQSIAELRAHLLGSAEAYALAGRTPPKWVDFLYAKVHHTRPSALERFIWSIVVALGFPRPVLAYLAVATPSAVQVAVESVYADLLGTAPSSDELAEGMQLVAGSDRRALVRVLASRAPYAPYEP